jgi:anhydro-N-acetylmuramic acid kinase
VKRGRDGDFEVPEIRRTIGLMSGTSLDGVDVALIETDGETIARFGPARTFPYEEVDRDIFRRATVAARAIKNRAERPGVLAEAERLVTLRHAKAVEAFLAAEGIAAGNIDLVGFHGQTVFHDPAKALTVQIGDGELLANRLGIAVVWDFRADDMAAGGQGAPLAPVFHRALAETAGLARPALFLNIGGVANVTYVGAGETLVAFDTGPGNALLDDWTFARTGKPFDADGKLAASGTANAKILAQLLAHRYFALPPPKSLDRDAFAALLPTTLSDADGAATLLHFTARATAAALARLPARPVACYASGGGRHNVALMRLLGDALADVPLQPLEALGFDGDATEAQAFAFLAVRAADRKPISYPLTTGVPAPLTGGRISRPATTG